MFWGSTSLLGQSLASEISVLLNGQPVQTLRVDKSNGDVMRQVVLTGRVLQGPNRLELRQTPGGQLPCTISAGYWKTSSTHGPNAPAETRRPLEITQAYDRTTLAVNDVLACRVTVRNHTGQTVPMAMVDLGVPPGFAVDTSPFAQMQAGGALAMFEVTETQVILYLRELAAERPLEFSYGLTACYPLRVQTPPARVYEYYVPTNRAFARSVALMVK